MRFGPGSFAFESWLRDAGIWNTRTLTVSQLLLGALAAPLLLAVLRELSVGWTAAAAAIVLLVASPIHARLSATSSEHVLASTLCLAFLFAWLRATRRGQPAWFALAMLLFPTVPFTRVDMAAQAALAWLWPLLPDRIERRPDAPALGPRVALSAVVVGATLAAAYLFIAVPSHHPFADPGGRLYAARVSISQFWSAAGEHPAWVTLPAVGLATLGVPAMLVRRPFLLTRVLGTLFVSFAVLGRTLTSDQLQGTRYFIFPGAVFLVLSGYGFETLATVVPRRLRVLATAAGLVALASWTTIDALPAYRVRYTFQDEYAFLRGALGQLPAGCIVYEVPIRPDAIPKDIDCCLDVPRSPLVLEFPALQLRALPDSGPTFDDGDCVAYYESSACGIRDDPADPRVHDYAATAVPYFQSRCGALRRSERFAPIASSPASPRAIVDFFQDSPPRVTLYRWTR
jgi:hypothetical protein